MASHPWVWAQSVDNAAPSHVIRATWLRTEMAKIKTNSRGISFRLVLYGYISQLKPPKALEKLSERRAASIKHHTWGSLGFEFPFPPIHPGLGRTNPYLAPAARPSWPSPWRLLVKAHLWMLTITLPPSSRSARWGRGWGWGLYNWFLEHTSCFMCLYQSSKEMKGSLPPFTPHLSILRDERQLPSEQAETWQSWWGAAGVGEDM